MTTPPARPKIYHIAHLDTLREIITEGRLNCDAEMVRRGGAAVTIGMSRIKERRLKELEVTCHPGTLVGDYVPFYFCPRSIMLYVLYQGNSTDLAYKGGQGPIVHLEADLRRVVEWADARNCKWAFSLSNAGATTQSSGQTWGSLMNWTGPPSMPQIFAPEQSLSLSRLSFWFTNAFLSGLWSGLVCSLETSRFK
jgi:hypothetical protein